MEILKKKSVFERHGFDRSSEVRGLGARIVSEIRGFPGSSSLRSLLPVGSVRSRSIRVRGTTILSIGFVNSMLRCCGGFEILDLLFFDCQKMENLL